MFCDVKQTVHYLHMQICSQWVQTHNRGCLIPMFIVGNLNMIYFKRPNIPCMYLERQGAVLIFLEKPSWKLSKWLSPQCFLMNQFWLIWSWGRGLIFVQYFSSQIHKLLIGEEASLLYSLSKDRQRELPSVTMGWGHSRGVVLYIISANLQGRSQSKAVWAYIH